jgi:hypothetical protein
MSLDLALPNLRVYPYFTYKPLIPTHFRSHFIVLKRIFLHVATRVVEGHHLHGMQCSMPLFIPRVSCYVVTVCSFCAAFNCHSFFGSNFEVINGTVLKRKTLTIS